MFSKYGKRALAVALGTMVWAGPQTVWAKDILHSDSLNADGCPPGTGATYQAGVDAYGRPVLAADLEQPMSIDMGDSTIVEPYLRSQNPALEQTRIQLHVSGLNEALHPDCLPLSGRPKK